MPRCAEPGAAPECIEGLGADSIPAMMWLVAGAVAGYGESDVAWLGTLVDAHRTGSG